MPFISIDESPLAPEVGRVDIHYREAGSGPPLVFLHGGWGYDIYPFDRQIDEFADSFKVVIPDRTGYGRSGRLEHLPSDFHRRAAVETTSVLNALHLERPVLWGHSDGAVIATLMGLESPDRFSGIILEAFHFYRSKPGSREFFEVMSRDPGLFGERIATTLAREHGEDYWHKMIGNNGNAWLHIAEEAAHARDDLYEGRLSELRVPALFIHGALDPRTEPGEMEAVRDQAAGAQIEIIEGGKHSPHSESGSSAECNRIVGNFLRSIG